MITCDQGDEIIEIAGISDCTFDALICQYTGDYQVFDIQISKDGVDICSRKHRAACLWYDYFIVSRIYALQHLHSKNVKM